MIRKQNVMWCRNPSLITRKKIQLTQSTKQTNRKHLKVKRTNLGATNQTNVWNWINQGHWINKELLKELKQKTK